MLKIYLYVGPIFPREVHLKRYTCFYAIGHDNL